LITDARAVFTNTALSYCANPSYFLQHVVMEMNLWSIWLPNSSWVIGGWVVMVAGVWGRRETCRSL